MATINKDGQFTAELVKKLIETNYGQPSQNYNSNYWHEYDDKTRPLPDWFPEMIEEDDRPVVEPLFKPKKQSTGEIVSVHTVKPKNWKNGVAFVNFLHLNKWAMDNGIAVMANAGYTEIEVTGTLDEAKATLEYCRGLNHTEDAIFPTKSDYRNAMPVTIAGEVDLAHKITADNNCALSEFGVEVWNWIHDHMTGRYWVMDDRIAFEESGDAVGFKMWYDNRLKSDCDQSWVYHKGSNSATTKRQVRKRPPSVYKGSSW